MTWQTIHQYAEEIELWSSLLVNVWVVTVAIGIGLARTFGSDRGIDDLGLLIVVFPLMLAGVGLICLVGGAIVFFIVNFFVPLGLGYVWTVAVIWIVASMLFTIPAFFGIREDQLKNSK